jgi:hypothetical protein
MFEIPNLRKFKIPELRGLKIPDLCRFKIPELRMSWASDLRKFVTSELRRFKIPDFAGSRFLKTHFTNFIKLDVVGEFKKTRHPRNVEVNEVREISFQEQRTREDLES